MIFPVFGYANPGKDYNFEQVYFQSYLDCLRQKKWNAIQKEYSAFGTLEEIASKANLEVIEKGLNWNTFSFEGYLTFNIFYDHSVHSERQKGLLWSPNSSTMMVYEVKSESSDESEVDLATVKQEFQDAMVERWFGQEMFFSASKAPIYNYDLYKLLLRL